MSAVKPYRIVLTAAQGPDSPAVRIRARLLAPALAERGVQLEPELLFDSRQATAFARGSVGERASLALRSRSDLRRRLRASSAPAALVQRQVDLLPSLRLERAARDGRRLILDVDDAIWHDARGGGHPLALLKGSRHKVRWLARRADQVVAGNDLLAEAMAGFGAQRIAIVPSLVDVERAPLRRHAQRDDVLVGWIGSRTTAPYLDRVVGAVDEAARRDGRRWTLECVGGAPSTPPITATLTEVAWSPAAEADLLGRMDIGLMPLPDTPWTRGKCAYKALQYLASGVPVVADDVGVTAEVVGSGGLVVGRPGDWPEALRTLARDADLRARLGAQGRVRVRETYSVAARIDELAALLAGC